MAKKFQISLVIAMILLMVAPSCKKDDSFHSIKTIEREIHLKINAYRNSQGLNELVEQFPMFEDAREISNKLANGTYNLGDPRIQDVVNQITQNWGGTSNGWVNLNYGLENSDSIVNAMLSDPASLAIIKMPYTQSGVGVSEGKDGQFYICHIFINIP